MNDVILINKNKQMNVWINEWTCKWLNYFESKQQSLAHAHHVTPIIK